MKKEQDSIHDTGTESDIVFLYAKMRKSRQKDITDTEGISCRIYVTPNKWQYLDQMKPRYYFIARLCGYRFV